MLSLTDHHYLKWCFLGMLLSIFPAIAITAPPPEGSPAALPPQARLALNEDWSTGNIDKEKWYLLCKKWGEGNHGVVPDNVWIEEDIVSGRKQNVLVCQAQGDQYTGKTIGWHGRKTRVGGVIVSREFFASGRFEVVMKVGNKQNVQGGPQNPAQPKGAVPAIWTYGYRWVEGDKSQPNQFVAAQPLYNPHMPRYGLAANEYWSEIDFPEFGKEGNFQRALYNTFCQTQHDSRLFDSSAAADGQYHTLTTEWRTTLKPLSEVTDNQVVQHLGFWWITDSSIPFSQYLGNPLRRLGKDKYTACWGMKATHWIDGKKVGENDRFVPAMAAQLNLGIWLPRWAGPAPWETSRVSFASIKVWQYDDEGDVRGVLVDNITNNFTPDGTDISP